MIPSSPSFSAVILRSTEVGVKARGVGEVVLGAGDIDPMLPIDTFGETDLQTKQLLAPVQVPRVLVELEAALF